MASSASGLRLGDRLIVAQLSCARAVVARSDDNRLYLTGIKAVVHEDALHRDRVLGDEEVAILAGEHLAALGAPLVERPHEGFLVACVSCTLP